MIAISKTDIYKCVEIYLLANTPTSLLNAFRNRLSEVFNRIEKESSLKTLIDYFEFITSKGKMSPVKVSISYLILILILYHKDYVRNETYCDLFGRLEWGLDIAAYVEASIVPVSIVDLKGNPMKITEL
jgi:hypothetical protein